MDIDSILDVIYQEKDNVKRGIKFENLVYDILQYKSEYKRVLLWKSFSKEYGLGHDFGTDIMCENHNGTWDAVQCKFLQGGTLDHTGIAKFMSSVPVIEKQANIVISNTILIHTADDISKAGKDKLLNSRVYNLDVLRSFNISFTDNFKIKPRKPLQLRDYQESAVQDVINGFAKQDRIDKRGRLIMACGTGKTLTALHVTEQLVKPGSIVLYLVPSISLIQQGLIDWSNNYNIQQRYTAVCSDKDVKDDIPSNELGAQVTTDPIEIKQFIDNIDNTAMNVIFCTYQSIDKIISVKGVTFDLIIADEAHRTTGSINKKQFTEIHNNNKISSRHRLYMTATPKVYGSKVDKVYSMDDESVYGPEFHKLGFYKAVEMGILADFRVKMVEIPEYLDNKLKEKMTDDDRLEWYAKLSALWHGVNYPDYPKSKDVDLLQRVLVFTNTVQRSRMFAGDKKVDYIGSFEKYEKKDIQGNTVSVKHIDGSTPIRKRREILRWLKSSQHDTNECRMVSNARVLGEGVDVPALDGIVFLDSKSSQVDIIQAVGRVMRRAVGKENGYIILPVVKKKGNTADETLSKSNYKIVWDVLKALRSHDENFVIEINQLILEDKVIPRNNLTDRFSMVSINEDLEVVPADPILFNEIKTVLVKKVGEHEYFDRYGKEIGEISRDVYDFINKEMHNNGTVQLIIDNLHKSLKKLLHDDITVQKTVETLSYHVVLSPVFHGLFDRDINFIERNPVAKAFEDCSKSLQLGYDIINNRIKMIDNSMISDEKLTKLYSHYKRIRREIEYIGDDNDKRQAFIIKIYDNFFKGADKKGTEKHGIVYTPPEIIDFIINSVKCVLRTEFNNKLFSDNDVKILDPFTGTGTFITRLIDSGYLDSNLTKKYREDIYANELMLLAYYVASVNIESTFTDKCRGNKHISFEGISYTDTFNVNSKTLGRVDNPQFKISQNRTKRQNKEKLNVIIGNPPYSVGDSNFNNQNKNIPYPDLDKNIENTYLKNSNISNKRSLYDSYIRAIRWSTDRIGESGVIGFVTNGSFIRSDAGSGLRASLYNEFTNIYCFDLRGNIRLYDKKEGGNIFGNKSQTPVAITILVKNPKKSKKKCIIHYKDIGDYLSTEQKLDIIEKYKSIQNISKNDWKRITPDKHHDWVNQRNNEFERYIVVGNKETKSGKIANSIFKLYSIGTKTHRDVWTFNSSREELSKNMKKTIGYCNKQNLNHPIINSKYVKWSDELATKLKKHKPKFDKNKIRISLYCPFFKQYLYFDSTYNTVQYQIPQIFPTNKSKNEIIMVSKGHGVVSSFISNIIPESSVIHHGQCFPMFTYNNGGGASKKTSPISHSNNTTISTKIHQSPKRTSFTTFMVYYTMKAINLNSRTTYKKSYPEFLWRPTLKRTVQLVENLQIYT